MSRIQPTLVTCPGCGSQLPARLFESLNGERIPAQVEALLAGTFEAIRCAACGVQFRPEHHMLYTHLGARMWIVMYPVSARGDYLELERSVREILERNFAEAAVIVADRLRGVRPRLVFGQHTLTEALRAAREAIDPSLLECAKLLAFKRSLPALLPLGPSELVFERIDETNQFVFGVHELSTAGRLGELALPSKLLGETRELLPRFEVSHPDLFQQPYVSALRYLYTGQL
ncbi:MAG TPA: CpXC domain-containing protein [Polyangia bacterium]|jgi:hypothetical protein|nr:CpXC domain-containing protein [Polyangia bacterium]